MNPRLPHWAWIAALILAFLVGAIYRLPLRLALRTFGVDAAVGNAALTGSITSWRAVAADGTEIRFDADVLTLLGAHYGGQIEIGRGAARLMGRMRREYDGSFTFGDGTFNAELSPLADLTGMPRSMLAGQLQIGTLQAHLRNGALVGLGCAGSIRAVRAGDGVTMLALGDLTVKCEDTAQGPTVTVEDQGGPLVFRSELRFAADGRFLLMGTAGARPGAPAELVEVLPLLGRSSGPDQVSFRYAGQLPALDL